MGACKVVPEMLDDSLETAMNVDRNPDGDVEQLSKARRFSQSAADPPTDDIDSDASKDISMLDIDGVPSQVHELGVEIIRSVDAGVTNTDNNDMAADALARVIDKEDFELMDIIGQFNLGFIVIRRRKLIDLEDDEGLAVMMDDLFIVD